MISKNAFTKYLSLIRKAGSVTGLLVAILTSLSFQAGKPVSDPSNPVFWLERAAVFVEAKQNDSAVFAYKAAITAARKHDDLENHYYAFWDWQSMVFEDPLESGRILENALQSAWRTPKSTEEWEALCYVYCNQAYHFFQTGQLLPSVQQYNKAYSIYKQYRFPDFPVIEYLYKPLGAHYVRLGDGAQARLLLSEALEIATTPAEQAGIWNNLGLSYWDDGMIAASDSCFRKGLRIINAPDIYKLLLRSGLAQLEVDKGEWDKAQKWLDAIPLYPSLSNESLDLWQDASLKINQLKAQVSLAKKDTNLTFQYLSTLQKLMKEVQNLSPRTKSRYFLISAKLYHAMGDTIQRNKTIEEIFKLLFHNSKIEISEKLNIYTESVVRDLFEFIGAIRSNSNPRESVIGYLLACKADLLLRSSYSFNASRLKVQQAMRKNIEAGLKVLYASNENPGQKGVWAWEFMELGKSLMLLESQQIWTQRDTSRVQMYKGLLLKEQAWLSAELALITDHQSEKRRHLSERLKANALALSRYSGENTLNVLEINELPELLEKSETKLWLNTFTGENDWYFLAYNLNQVPVLKALPARQNMKQVQDWQRFLSKRTIGEEPEIPGLQQLMQDLLVNFRFSENIIISADGFLGNIPWAAIKIEHGFLIEKVNLKFAFSASVWKAQLERSTQPITEIVAFAPFNTGSRHGFPALQFSSREIAALPDHAVKYIDEEAAIVNLRKYQNKQAWIHLSTHGWTDTSGNGASIAFYDSLLVMHDLFQWSFPGTVFVLSACETFKGEIQEGEGVMSMARQLAQAGANGMVSTQWKVNEKSTGYLFESFYKNLNGHTPSQALRLAQLSYLKDPKIPAWEKTPYYWAGLIYVGVDHSYVSQSAHHWYWVGAIFFLVMLLFFMTRKQTQPGSTPS